MLRNEVREIFHNKKIVFMLIIVFLLSFLFAFSAYAETYEKTVTTLEGCTKTPFKTDVQGFIDAGKDVMIKIDSSYWTVYVSDNFYYVPATGDIEGNYTGYLYLASNGSLNSGPWSDTWIGDGMPINQYGGYMGLIVGVDGVDDYIPDNFVTVDTSTTTTVNTGYGIQIDGPRTFTISPYGTATYTYMLYDSDYQNMPFPDYGELTISTDQEITLSATQTYTIEVTDGQVDVIYEGEADTIVNIEDEFPIVELSNTGDFITVTNNTSSQQEFYLQSEADELDGPWSWVYYSLNGENGYMTISKTGSEWDTLYLEPGESIYLELSESFYSFSDLRIDLNDLTGSEIKFNVTQDNEPLTTLKTMSIYDKQCLRVINNTSVSKTVTFDLSAIDGIFDAGSQIYQIPLQYNSSTGKYYPSTIDTTVDVISKDEITEVIIGPGEYYDFQLISDNVYVISYYAQYGFDLLAYDQIYTLNECLTAWADGTGALANINTNPDSIIFDGSEELVGSNNFNFDETMDIDNWNLDILKNTFKAIAGVFGMISGLIANMAIITNSIDPTISAVVGISVLFGLLRIVRG